MPRNIIEILEMHGVLRFDAQVEGRWVGGTTTSGGCLPAMLSF